MRKTAYAAPADAPADAPPGNWVDAYAPAAARPYLRMMRADRPIGTWLLLIPCWQGQALAAGATGEAPNLLHTVLFAVGAFVMRGAGCAFNDVVDRDIDAQVERTARRPLPSGQVSVRAALALIVGLSLVGLAILLQLHPFAIGVGLASLALVAAYPFMKRITYWPQIWLGITLNWGILVAYADATGGLDAPALLLWAGAIAWTVGYDTIYAHQDKEDDAIIGVKSSALRLGAYTPRWLVVFYGAYWALTAAAGLAAGLGPLVLVALLPTAAHLVWQQRSVDLDDGARCLRVFKSNRDSAILTLLGLSAAAALRHML